MCEKVCEKLKSQMISIYVGGSKKIKIICHNNGIKPIKCKLFE